MCGRYQFRQNVEDPAMHRLQQLALNNGYILPHGDLIPGCEAPVLINGPHKAQLHRMQWGFPLADTGRLIFNARAESAGEKRMFAHCLREQRCVIPTTGFYEWSHGNNAQQYHFRLPGEAMLYLAGLYDQFETVPRFVVLTCPAVAQVSTIHHRQPVVLRRSQILPWLRDGQAAMELLRHEGSPLQGQAVDWEED